MQASIIGLGWLGLPLARNIQDAGGDVIGTTRTPEKRQRLEQEGFKALLFDVFDDAIAEQLPAAFFENRQLIINIAPGRRNIEAKRYIDAISSLISHAFTHGASHLTFVSTTSVFGEQHGVLNESSPVMPVSNSAIAHSQLEQYLLNVFTDKSCVIRLAGLIGPQADIQASDIRHPVTSLVKREEITGGNAVVNLVHQFDAIQCIFSIMKHKHVGKIFHACATDHPTRKDYYTWAAQQMGLSSPKFINDGDTASKIIDASESFKSLGVTLRYPSPYDMLSDKR
ncbi:SDR family oxidoreductase [Glaciecola sp. XM2]|uniref:SDR family oxidoreductase n=1 Tax=Glaciecola sp. XM2 TaxID=1914931 RepID=UPI001BDE5BE0|nr:SDR family oxidoreductase [Glaciecola sp. XM2]MBT1451124.1 SDR family oxidoreductase [Glaciecola sp. XM2]